MPGSRPQIRMREGIVPAHGRSRAGFSSFSGPNCAGRMDIADRLGIHQRRIEAQRLPRTNVFHA